MIQLDLARLSETLPSSLGRDIGTLAQWLRHDVLALAVPVLATRQILFDFIVEELSRREPRDPGRIRPVRVALQKQRDDLTAFAGVLDEEFLIIARVHEVSDSLVREGCVFRRLRRAHRLTKPLPPPLDHPSVT